MNWSGPAYWPSEGAAGRPDPDGATWPKCGHPKTDANTQNVGRGRLYCRICRRKTNREYLRRKTAQKAKPKRKALN